MNNSRNNSSENESESWDQLPQSIKKNQRSIQGKVQQLIKSHQHFKEFINNIGEQIRNKQIRPDVILQYGRQGLQKITYNFIEEVIKLRIQKMIKNGKIKKNWNEQDVKCLIWIVSKYLDFQQIKEIQSLNQNDWKVISSIIPGVSVESCLFKWLSLKRIKLSSNNWNEEQSSLLKKLVSQIGLKDWKTISIKLYKSNSDPYKIYRTPKQCREHWICYLNPNLKKGPWQKQQDIQLMKSVKQKNCQKKWSEIVHLFDGRTQNALKNRYTLLIQKQKKIYSYLNPTQLNLINLFLDNAQVNQFMIQSKRQKKNNNNKKKNSQQQIPEQFLLNAEIKYQYSNKRNDEHCSNITYIKINKENIKNYQLIKLKVVPCVVLEDNALIINSQFKKEDN